MRTKQLSRGFSLVEILLVLGIIAILSIGAFIIFAQVKDSSDANTESQNLTTIIAGVRNLYGIRADYTGITTDIVNAASIFPPNMNGGVRTAGHLILHAGGGEVEVIPWGADSKMFAVVYNNVSKRLCIKIAQNYGRNVEIVMVGSVEVKSLGSIGSDPALSTVECNRSESSMVVFIQK